VSVLTFLFPSGGAVVTVRNLQRLDQVSARTARALLIIVIAVFALGLALLVLTSQKDKSGKVMIDSGAYLIVSVGAAVASYLAQRNPFRSWRTAHTGVLPGSLLEAIALVLLYQLVAALVAAPVVALAAQASGATFGVLQ
jgi:hypothetical protein